MCPISFCRLTILNGETAQQRFSNVTYEDVEQARNYLLDRIGSAPDIAVIMGSGMSAVGDILQNSIRTQYSAIPHFRVPKVSGHRGEAVFGKAGGLNVL